jgi:hypothetical protein
MIDQEMLLVEQDNSPKTHLISIAVSNYKNYSSLPNAVKDSDAIIECLKKYKVDLHDKIHDADFTEERIEKTFRELSNKINQKDSLVIFYNGHGEKDNKELFYWVTQKAERNVSSSWYLSSKIFNEIKKLDIAHVALVVNCCYSGIMHTQEINANKSFIQDKDDSRILLTGGRLDQGVDDSSENSDNSPFTEGLLKYLYDNNDEPKRSLSNSRSVINALFAENKTHHKPTLSHFGGHQGGDFYFILKEDDKAYWTNQKKIDSIESYLSYTQKYPVGLFVLQANDRIDVLVKERTKWLRTLIEVKQKFLDFKTESELIQGKFIKEAQKSFDELENKVKELEKVEVVEQEWKRIRNSDKVGDFKKFDTDYPNSRYKNESKRKQDKLVKEEKAKKDWEKIPNKQNPQNRRSGLIAFINDHPLSSRVVEADGIKEDIEEYIDAIDEGQNVEDKIVKLKRYIGKEKKGEYSKQAIQELATIQNKRNQEYFETKLQSAIDDEDFATLYEIEDEIKGLTKEEQVNLNPIYTRICILIEEYEVKRKSDFKEALEDKEPQKLVFFIKKYKDGDLVEKLKEEFQDREQNFYDESEDGDSIESYDAYLKRFKEFENEKVVTLNYFNRVKIRLKELTKDRFEFEKANNDLDKLNEYVSNVNSKELIGKFLVIAEDEIKKIKFEQEKQDMYERIMQENSVLLFEEFLEKFPDDKDERNKTVEEAKAQLIMIIKREESFNNLLNEDNLSNKIKNCQSFLNIYSDMEDGKYIEEVSKLRDESIQEQNDDEEFEDIIKIEDVEDKISKLKSYSAKENPKHKDEANSLKGKLLLEIEDDEKEFEYLKNLEGIELQIEGFEKYLRREKPRNKLEAESILKELELERRDLEAFNDTNDNNDTIDGWSKYIPVAHNKDRKELAIQKRGTLKKIKQEDKDFKDAKSKNTKSSYDSYLEKYRNDGRYSNIEEAEKLRSKIILGISDTSKVSESEKIQGTITDLKTFIDSQTQILKFIKNVGIFITIIVFVITLFIFITWKFK